MEQQIRYASKMVEGPKISSGSYLKYLHVVTWNTHTRKRYDCKGPGDYHTLRAMWAVNWPYPLTKPRRKLQGRYFNITKQRISKKKTFIAMLLRDKKLQLIHMCNLLSLEKKNKTFPSLETLLCPRSWKFQMVRGVHSRDTGRLFMLRLEN